MGSFYDNAGALIKAQAKANTDGGFLGDGELPYDQDSVLQFLRQQAQIQQQSQMALMQQQLANTNPQLALAQKAGQTLSQGFSQPPASAITAPTGQGGDPQAAQFLQAVQQDYAQTLSTKMAESHGDPGKAITDAVSEVYGKYGSQAPSPMAGRVLQNFLEAQAMRAHKLGYAPPTEEQKQKMTFAQEDRNAFKEGDVLKYKEGDNEVSLVPVGRNKDGSLKYERHVGSTSTTPVGGSLDADAKYLAAVNHVISGKLPTLVGKAGTKDKEDILKWSAQLSKDSTWRPSEWTDDDSGHLSFNDAVQTANNANAFKLAGNPTIATRTTQLKALPVQLQKFQDVADQLKFPGNPVAAETKAQYLIQTGDPRMTSYMTRRADIVQELANALRARGATDKAVELEKTAASNYLSPAKFREWVAAQEAAISSQSDILGDITKPKFSGQPTISQEAPATAPKRVKVDMNGNVIK